MTDKSDLEIGIEKSKRIGPGGDHYRAYIGPPLQYDFMGATQFSLLFLLGIREEHYLLDLGCGSLRAGRFLISFLLPRRYFGIEPNSWLWEEVLANEIGHDIVQIKEPKFSTNSSFDLTDLGQSFDFIVAQSIFSHTGENLFKHSLVEAYKSLKPSGQFLFTVLDEKAYAYHDRQRGDQESGWIYPECVTFDHDYIVEQCSAIGLFVQRLNWFHPRQTWYRGVLDAGMIMTKDEINNLGSGKPLFDSRFPK